MPHWETARGDAGRAGAVDARASAARLAILAALPATALPLLGYLLPAGHVLPLFSLIALAASLAVASLTWHGAAPRQARGFTSRDLAGSLAFLGFAAGMLSDPGHVIELFGAAAASP